MPVNISTAITCDEIVEFSEAMVSISYFSLLKYVVNSVVIKSDLADANYSIIIVTSGLVFCKASTIPFIFDSVWL
jgi:hypothetical protein